MKKHLVSVVPILLAVATASSYAQRAPSYKLIEVWGLGTMTRQQFIAKHKKATGMGLEGACMATLKDKLGYKHTNVILFPNPEEMDQSMMLITLRDVPMWEGAVQPSERRDLGLPQEWSALNELASTTYLGSFEFQNVGQLLPWYATGTFDSIATYIDAENKQFAAFGGHLSLDSARQIAVLDAVNSLHDFGLARTMDLLLYADSATTRKLAAIVLLNHPADAQVARVMIRAIWDDDVSDEARSFLYRYMALQGGSSLRQIVDAEAIGAMLNHPDPSVCDLGMQMLTAGEPQPEIAHAALSMGGLTVEEFLRSKISGEGPYARNFSHDAVAFLRKVSGVDMGEKPELWIRWLRSVRKG